MDVRQGTVENMGWPGGLILELLWRPAPGGGQTGIMQAAGRIILDKEDS